MTTTTKVAVLDDYFHRAADLADWDALGPDVEVTFFYDSLGEESLFEELVGFDIVVLMRERSKFPRRLLERLPKLRLLVTTGMRNASVDADYLHHRGIAYAGTQMTGPRHGVPTTVEQAWALIFALAKRVVTDDQAVRAGTWQTGFPIAVAGLTLGLVGLGNLGAAMVGPARAFGMDVVAWSTNLTDERAAEAGATRVSKEELLARADFLSIHLVLSDRSRGLIGTAELAAMKSTAYLINTSRGPIVDEDALVAALRGGVIAGAGLDVYDREPLPPHHPLLALDNTVLAPHLGYVTEPGFRQMYGQVVEDIKGFLDGTPVRLIV